VIAFTLFLVVSLAVFGIVAGAFGVDSRDGLGDTHAGNRTRRTI
jgi:hypothetical protein